MQRRDFLKQTSLSLLPAAMSAVAADDDRSLAVDHVRAARDIHLAWLELLADDDALRARLAEEPSRVRRIVGSEDYHRMWVIRYDRILRVLEAG